MAQTDVSRLFLGWQLTKHQIQFSILWPITWAWDAALCGTVRYSGTYYNHCAQAMECI